MTAIKESTGDRIFNAFVLGLATFLALIVMYPLIYIVSCSVSDPNLVATGQIWLLPKGLNIDGYVRVFQDKNIMTGYANTIMYTVGGTLINLAMTLTCGYALSKNTLPGKALIITYLFITMYFSGGLIPSFVLINKLGLYNTFWVMIIPSMVGIWNIILVRTFIRNIPYSLQESALIDGANEFQILWKIIMPLSTAILAVLALYSLVGSWNSYFSSMIYQPNRDLHPIQMYMRRVLLYGEQSLMDKNTNQLYTVEAEHPPAGTMTQLKYAAIIFTNLPIICSYPFLQKYFIKGVMIGSLKG